MRIYVPQIREGQSWVMPRNGNDALQLLALNGPRSVEWKTIAMKDLNGEQEIDASASSEMPWFNRIVLMLLSKAVACLTPLLEPFGEFLPLASDRPLKLFNATARVPALDETRSEIVRYDDGDILTIDRHVLRPEAIGSVLAFRLVPDSGAYNCSPIYLQDPVIEALRMAGVTGTDFKLIWSDAGVAADQEIVSL